MKTKRLFNLPLFFLLLVTTTVLSQDFTDGNFTFRVNDDGGDLGNTVTIIGTEINGLQNNGVLNVPATASRNGTRFDVTRINGGVFIQSSGAPDNEKFRQVNLPHGLLSIGQDAFRFNRIESLDIPSSVRDLAQGAFRDNEIESFRYVDENGNETLDAEMRSFGTFAFKNNNLREVSFSTRVNNIGNEAFDDNPIQDVTVHMATPPALSGNAFNNRNTIRLQVTISSSVDAFKNSSAWDNFLAINGIFDGTPGQELSANSIIYRFLEKGKNDVDITGANGNIIGTNVVINETVTLERLVCNVIDIRNSAFEGRSIQSVTINSSSLRRIRGEAFRNNNIKTVTFGPNVGVTDIEIDAFNGNDIKEITIPASVENIGSAAFRNNPIERVRPLSNTPPSLAGDAFSNNDRNIIQVSLDGTPNQAQAKTNYKNASDWQGFFSIDDEYTGSAGFSFSPGDGIRYRTKSDANTEVDLLDSNASQVPSNLTIDNFVFRGVSFQIIDILGESLRNRGIQRLTINSPTIRRIRGSAFRENQIESLIFGPDVTVEQIEVDAFNQNNLTEITIPASVNSIGDASFKGNPIQKMITTPINAPFLDSNTFDERRNILLEISEDGQTLSQNTAQLESYANSNDWNGFFAVNGIYDRDPGVRFTENSIRYEFLESGTNNVDIVASEASVASNLTIGDNININGIECNVIDIRNVAFQSRNLTALTINSSTLKRIRASAFRNNSIGTLTFGNNVTVENIEIDAFNNAFNDNDRVITIPASVIDIGDSAFTNNEIKEVTLLGITPPRLDSNAFTDRRDIRLQVPDAAFNAYKEDAQWGNFFSVNGRYIGEQRDLTSGEIIYRLQPEKNEVIVIGSRDIETTLTIPSGVRINKISFIVTTVNNGALENKGLINLTIGEGIRLIKENAFRNNSIVSLNLPATLTTIESNAFRNNELTSIRLPDTGLEAIGDFAFFENPTIEVISKNRIAPSLEVNSFRDRSLIDLFVVIGSESSYTEKGWTGFRNNIEEVDIVVGDKFTLDNAIYEITSLQPAEAQLVGVNGILENLNIKESVIFNNAAFSVTSIKKRAVKNNVLNNVVIPNTITAIPRSAFENNLLTNVIIPDGVTSIGDEAFEDNRLTMLTIPASVVSIGVAAFGDVGDIKLSNLITTVVAQGAIPPGIVTTTDDLDSFTDRSIIDLFVPFGTTQAYLDAGWTGFKSITEIEVDIVLTPKVFLQGAAVNPINGEDTLLRDDLRVAGVLPTTSPYIDGLTTESLVLETVGANAIVDWVFVQLRDATDQSIVVAEQSALLQRDGDVVGIDGVSPLRFTQDAGDYFIAVEHRNHLGILSTNAIALSSAGSSVDFTTDLSVTQGGINALVAIREGVFAMVAGDLDENGQVQPSDVSQTTALIGTASYSNADMDMNGQIQPADVNTLINPNVGRGVQLLSRSTVLASKSAQEQIEFIYAPKVQAPNKQAATGRQLKF